MDVELAKRLRVIKTGLKKGEDSGLLRYSEDEPLTDNWVYHIYEILVPEMLVKVNGDIFHENTDEVSFGEPCGNLRYGSLLWMVEYIRTLEFLQKK